jgi:hypothetical protein
MGTALRILLVVVALLMLAGIYAVQWTQARLLEAGVQSLEWSDVRLSGRELSIGAVSGLYSAEQGQLEFAARDVRLVFVWAGGPRFEVVDLGDLELDWEPAPQPPIDPLLLPDPAALEAPEEETGPHQLPDPHDWFSFVDFLPHVTRVRNLRLGVPCHGEPCELTGSLVVESEPGTGAHVGMLSLLHGEELLEWVLRLDLQPDLIEADSTLSLSGIEALHLESALFGRDAGWRWTGQVSLPGWAGTDWIFDFISPWLPPEQMTLDRLPPGLQLNAQWVFAPGRQPRNLADLLAGEVTLEARGELPEPWALEQIGHLQGRLALVVEGRNGQWRLHQGEAGVRLDQLDLPQLAELPAGLRPSALRVDLRPEAGSELHWQATLPLALVAELEGPLRGSLKVRVLLSSLPGWTAEFERGQLELNARRVNHGELVLAGIRARLPFEGQLTEQGVHLRLASEAALSIEELVLADPAFNLSEVRLGVPGLTAEIPLSAQGALRARSRIQLAVSRVEQASLKTQGWNLTGELSHGTDATSFVGNLASVGGLGVDVRFAWPQNRPWRAELRLQDIFFRAANPLAAVLADWPQLLSLGTGRLTGRFEVVGNPGLERFEGRLEATGLGGIYDRAAFEGLGFPLDVSLRDDALTLVLPSLTLASYDPGIPLGPLSLNGRYTTSLDAPLEGRPDIRQASLGLLGGRLVLQPGELDLSQPTHHVLVEMEGLQLARLFEVYPAEGLAGHGTLDGRLPVSLTDGRLTVEAGRLEAREPGGVLQYRSDKLREMGRANPGMRELALALDDFRYTVLSSDLDYGSDGVLILGLRLEGSNPALQRGRPVHLNVRLEEDIPALLASLQLSGQVSDIIQRRVQERLLQQRLSP